VGKILRSTVQELPFGQVVEGLFEEVEKSLAANASNKEFCSACILQLKHVRQTVARLIEAQFESIDIFRDYVNVLCEMQNVLSEWSGRSAIGKRVEARDYKSKFEQLFLALERATRDLTLCVVVEAKAEAQEEFRRCQQTMAENQRQLAAHCGEVMNVLRILMQEKDAAREAQGAVAVQTQDTVVASLQCDQLLSGIRIINVKSIEFHKERPMRGGQGIVRRATMSLSKGRAVEVAVKTVPAGEDEEEALVRELALLAKMRHPNIVKLFGQALSQDTGEVWAVMEYAQLGTLRDVLDVCSAAASLRARRPLTAPLPVSKARRMLSALGGGAAESEGDESTVVEAARAVESVLGGSLPGQTLAALGVNIDVVRGVAHIHGQNMAHGDLKPRNVLVFADGTAKIADLGIAEVLHSTVAGAASRQGFARFTIRLG